MQRLSAREHARIVHVLTSHLKAAATKDTALLRNSFTADGVFIGTDDTEQWSIKQLVQVLESTENGWDMTTCIDRSIYKISGAVDNTVVFFEVIRHKKYGIMRGSGVIIKTDGVADWRIAQYVLSFSVPNNVVSETNILQLLGA